VENPFQQAARAKKTLKLVEHFDREMLVNGLDPFVHSIAMVTMLRDQTSEAQWRIHATLCGQRPPSDDTKKSVINAYERRAEAFASNKATPIRRFGGTH